MKILDACCGGKMFWFDRENPDTTFMDMRDFDTILCDGRSFSVHPDVVGDFRNMPFDNETFDLVVFDPPHLKNVGEKSYIATKYGKLDRDTWQEDLRKGFDECWRVLRFGGTLIFKWNERQIKTSEVLKCFSHPPLFGNRSGKSWHTHWLVFCKAG